MKFTVVGSGIAGLSFSYQALEGKHDVDIIEISSSYGGLCKSFKKRKCILDLGVHLFHGRDSEVLKTAKKIVPLNKWVDVKRVGKLYIAGRYIDWPIRITSLFQLPVHLSFNILIDQLFLLVKDKKIFNRQKNYQTEILSVYGKTLFNYLFKPLTEKFFQTNTKKIHFDWAFSSIRSATKIEDKNFKEGYQYLVEDTSEESKKSFNIFRFVFSQIINSFKKEDFYYFKDGYGTLANYYVKKIKSMNGKIRLNSQIEQIKFRNNLIQGLTLNGIYEDIDQLVWTGNLENLCSLLSIKPPQVKRLHSKFLYVFLKNNDITHQVCYYIDQNISFVRSTVLNNHYQGIIKNKKIKAVLCLEFTSSKQELSDANPIITGKEFEIIKNDLLKVGLINSFDDILDFHTIFVANTYPIFTTNYRKEIKRVKNEIGKFKNLTLFGRQGSFSYENADGLIKDALRHELLQKA